MEKMKKGHVMMVPYPAQGHVIPMLELAHILAEHDVKITFVNVEFIHDLVSSSSSHDLIRFVSIPDGLEPDERGIPEKFIERVWIGVPERIEKLVEEANEKDDDEEEKVTCLLSDHHLCRIQQVAKKLGIQSALFSAASAAMFPLIFNVPNLILDGTIDDQGNPLKKKTIRFSSTMPKMNPFDFFWYRESKAIQKAIFKVITQDFGLIESADWVLCNSSYDLEHGAFDLLPHHVLPIGPLLGRKNSAGHFIEQDSDCLDWLDQQPPCSVIYVAFGSTAVLSNAQFQELGLGLEGTNRPFLWVVRPDSIPGAEKVEFPEGFLERVAGRGRITGWAPQQKVLSHPSVACFVTHCGWNSTIESVSCGVRMLCWPYFSDQFVSQSYICDIWRVGLQFQHDDRTGNILSEEFKKKVDLILGDEEIKERALMLKKMIENTTKEGGNSCQNLRNFVTWIKK